MNIFIILPIALALGMDAFAVSVGISIKDKGLTARQVMRLSCSFGFFQFLMPLLGWFAGQKILSYLQAWDHWVAFSLLCVIGGHMIWGAWNPNSGFTEKKTDPTSGWALLLASIATSIDALALGMSFAFLGYAIIQPAAVIGIVAFGMTVLGAKLGRVLGSVFGKWAELAGGLVLILIGLKILIEHL